LERMVLRRNDPLTAGTPAGDRCCRSRTEVLEPSEDPARNDGPTCLRRPTASRARCSRRSTSKRGSRTLAPPPPVGPHDEHTRGPPDAKSTASDRTSGGLGSCASGFTARVLRGRPRFVCVPAWLRRSVFPAPRRRPSGPNQTTSVDISQPKGSPTYVMLLHGVQPLHSLSILDRFACRHLVVAEWLAEGEKMTTLDDEQRPR